MVPIVTPATTGKDRTMTRFIKNFVSDERGLETLEYAVMTALIVAAIVTAVGALVTAVTGRFGEVETTITGI